MFKPYLSGFRFGAEVVGPVNRLVEHAGGGRRREIKGERGRGYRRGAYCEQKELGEHSLEPGSRGSLEPDHVGCGLLGFVEGTVL